MKKIMLSKITIVTLIFLSCGCDTAAQKQPAGKLQSPGTIETVKLANAGTLVSVGPAMQTTRRPGQLESAILGETKLSRTRVETTRGVYIINEKIGIAETGSPVTVEYDASGSPSYLNFGGKRYKIVR